ncbi:hypothetical protein [Clostridium intestinale]|uniref:M1 family metallopeptidase n=1 Tax=Clostridium intestinale TaxID=36845 RepID=A0A7D6ZWD7_9CLOT|nr:hypothetical protein [Clostridium intestinale]QLY81413.1 hypothetical protein HZF06_07475 [Clostridium intestinale]
MGFTLKKTKFFKWVKKNKIISIIIAAIILITSGVTILNSIPRKFQLEYTIGPKDIDNKILNVNVRITPVGMFKPKQFVLVKGNMNVDNESCLDNEKNKVNFGGENGIVVIDELKSGSKYIDYNYDVEIARLGKHGYNSQVYREMLSYEGEAVLAMPLAAIDGNNEKADIVDNIKIQNMVPDVWDSIIPFPSEDSMAVTEVKNPSWIDLHEIRKSSYTFGDFKEDKHLTDEGGYTVYVDPKAEKFYTEEAKEGLESLFDYYSKIFKHKLNNYSVVILRTEGEKNGYIIGGSSSINMASTFNPENSRDWQLMGHRLFHAFFESTVSLEKFNKAPILNFYEGLATYYENMSMMSLSQSLRDRLNIYPDNEFGNLFERYTYMKLKSPEYLNFALSDEASISASPGRLEFLHYTQAPLVVKYMEETIAKNTSNEDNILNYILENKDEESLSMDSIAKVLMGEDSKDFINKYVKGYEIVPLWDLAKTSGGDNRDVINSLNEYEYLLYTWFSQENELYKNDNLSADNLVKIAEEADNEGAKFASEDLENQIKDMSPTMYNLLKEYALRVKVCSLELGSPYLREQLLSNRENTEKWNEFLRTIK